MTQKESVLEQRQKLACTIARDGAREQDLLSKTQRIRMEIHDLEAHDQGLSLPGDATKAAILAAQKGRDARHAKVASLKTELERLEVELTKVSPALLAAHQALGKIEGALNTERRTKIAAAVESAATAAAGSREVFRAERAKQASLRDQLETAESQLHILEISPPSNPANVEARARELLKSGVMPAGGPVVDGSVRRNELRAEIRTLTEAVRLQEQRVSQAGRQFADELGAALRPTMGDIARRIAGGVESARLATQECLWIETAVAVASGGESLPSVRYPGIQPPMDVADGFMFWLTRIRLSGFEV